MTTPYWVPLGAAPRTAQVTYGTTPPASPVDGDEWVLPADAANGVMWEFRYRAASASVYKWEFVGGAAATAIVNANEQHPGPNGTWQNLATNGPSFILPRAGDYEVGLVARVYKQKTEAQSGHCGIAVGDTSPSIYAGYQDDYTGSSAQATLAMTWLFTGLSAGTTMKLRYFAGNNSGTAPWAGFATRQIRIIPVRVS